MKKPDSLILIAIWEFISAFVAFIGIVAIAVFAIPAVLRRWSIGRYYNNGMMMINRDVPRLFAIFCLSILIILLLCYLAIAITAGVGLLKGKEWGRITGIVQSALSLFFFVPIGTVIGVLSIIYLTKQEVKDYFNPPPKVTT